MKTISQKTWEALPTSVLHDIVMTLKGPESLLDLTPEEALDRWLSYNGIIGFTSQIIKVWTALSKEDVPVSRERESTFIVTAGNSEVIRFRVFCPICGRQIKKVGPMNAPFTVELQCSDETHLPIRIERMVK